MGRHHAPRFEGRAEALAAAALGLTIGFYDGFFGPGTGSFFVFLFVRWLGYDFLHASASAKLLNATSNLAAFILFAYKGHVWWHLALKHGSGFVRVAFIVVVGALILKTGYDAWVR